MTRLDSRGFSLIELIMIIVLIAIMLPAILNPFINAARGISTPSDIARLTMIARGHMDEEVENIMSPTLNFTTTPKNAASNDTLDGNSYATTVTKAGCDFVVGTPPYSPFDCTTNPGTPSFIQITVTTTSGGKSVTLQSIKSKLLE